MTSLTVQTILARMLHKEHGFVIDCQQQLWLMPLSLPVRTYIKAGYDVQSALLEVGDVVYTEDGVVVKTPHAILVDLPRDRFCQTVEQGDMVPVLTPDGEKLLAQAVAKMPPVPDEWELDEAVEQKFLAEQQRHYEHNQAIVRGEWVEAQFTEHYERDDGTQGTTVDVWWVHPTRPQRYDHKPTEKNFYQVRSLREFRESEWRHGNRNALFVVVWVKENAVFWSEALARHKEGSEAVSVQNARKTP